MGKKAPLIVYKEGTFIKISLRVNVVSKEKIYATVVYANVSADVIRLPKVLLPINGQLSSEYIYILDENSLENLSYIGDRKGRYLKGAPDDDIGFLLPESDSDSYIELSPNDSLNFKVNLVDYYQFSDVVEGTLLAVTVIEDIPVVSADYKQVKEIDSVDNKLKPVYYSLSLSEHIDSSKVHFKFPDNVGNISGNVSD